MFQVTACIAERVGGAAALFKVIVSSSVDCLIVTLSSFYLLSFFYTVIVYFPSSRAPSSPIFGHVDPIIVGLIPSFDWVFIFLFFKYLFEENH